VIDARTLLIRFIALAAIALAVAFALPAYP